MKLAELLELVNKDVSCRSTQSTVSVEDKSISVVREDINAALLRTSSYLDSASRSIPSYCGNYENPVLHYEQSFCCQNAGENYH